MAETNKPTQPGGGKPVRGEEKNVTLQVPKAQIELTGDGGFRIVLERLRDQVMDQSRMMQVSEGQGCISSPSGPSC